MEIETARQIEDTDISNLHKKDQNESDWTASFPSLQVYFRTFDMAFEFRLLMALRAQPRPVTALLVTVMVLTGCGIRPSVEVLKPVALPAPAQRVVTVYVATTRKPEQNGLSYGDGKAPMTRYLEYTISIPPNHEPGKIEYPGINTDLEHSFAVVGKRILDRRSFLTAVDDRPRKEAGVFVHGFNYSFQESLFRLAQMSADAQVDGAPILFAWPSTASLAGYVADKEAAIYSRDALAELLSDLSHTRLSKIVVFGHSMGGWLTTEALRQLRLTGKNQTLNRLTVILAAPDIDTDVFRKDMETIGKLSHPLTLLVAPDDRALKVAALVSDDQRVGRLDINDPNVQETATRFNIAIVDISNLSAPDPLHHDRYIALASLFGQLDSKDRPSGIRHAGAFLFDVVGKAASTPFSAASRAIAGN